MVVKTVDFCTEILFALPIRDIVPDLLTLCMALSESVVARIIFGFLLYSLAVTGARVPTLSRLSSVFLWIFVKERHSL